MPAGVLTWLLVPNVVSFWLLMFFGTIWISLNIAFFNHDESVLRFSDDAHCLAFIRKAKLEGLAEKIRRNPEEVELVDAQEFLRSLDVKNI